MLLSKKWIYFYNKRKKEKRYYTPFLEVLPKFARAAFAHPILHVYSCFMMKKRKKIWVFVCCLWLLLLWLFSFPSLLCLVDPQWGHQVRNHLRAAAGTRHCCMARKKRRDDGRLFAGNVTTKGLRLDPVHEDKDTVASAEAHAEVGTTPEEVCDGATSGNVTSHP